MYPYRFLTLNTQPLFHLRTEVSFVAGDYRDDLLNVFPDLLFQHNGTDIVPTALIFVRTMGGTDKEVLPLFKVACGRVIQLLLAVIAEHKAGEHIALACCRSAVALLPDFLYLIKHFQRNNCRVGIFKNLPVFLWVVPLLLVPNGVGVGLEVDRAAGIFPVFENVGNRALMPAIFVFRCLMRCFTPLPLFVGSGVEYLILFELCSNLARPFALHTERKNLFDNPCRFLVHNPLLRIIGMLFVSIRNIRCQPFTTLTLCLVDRTDFAAGIPRIKLVEPVPDSGKIVVDAVGIDCVIVVIDGNEADAMLGKGEVDKHTRHSGVS